MADTATLHDAFLEELKDSYDAERQLVKALPKLAKTATHPKLKEAFESHLEETRGHVELLEQVFESLKEKPRGKHCDGIAGIIDEGKDIMHNSFDSPTMDACLIAAAQRAEHYEIAAYGTLVAWAKDMGHTESVALLERILDQEKAADQKLTAIGQGGVNQQAASRAHAQQRELVGTSGREKESRRY